MAEEKNIIIKNHNGTDWDILHPETSSEQVKTSATETLNITLGKKS